MNIVTDQRSPNFSDLVIPVEFVVLHFTAATLERTLEIFMSRSTEVSAHLVIDRDGTVYELVECLNGVVKRAWHAGRSRCEVNQGSGRVIIEGFNDRSIGVELVNLNGNLFPYSEAQYQTLFALLERLKGMYSSLHHPESIIGHEQISGFRGKSDPGRCFEWDRLFSVCYPQQGIPQRGSVCSETLAARIGALVGALGVTIDAHTGVVSAPDNLPGNFFGLLSALSEAALSREV